MEALEGRGSRSAGSQINHQRIPFDATPAAMITRTSAKARCLLAAIFA